MGYAKYLEDIIRRMDEGLPSRPSRKVTDRNRLQDIHRALHNYYARCRAIHDDVRDCLKQAHASNSFELAKRTQITERQLESALEKNIKLTERLQDTKRLLLESTSKDAKSVFKYKKENDQLRNRYKKENDQLRNRFSTLQDQFADGRKVRKQQKSEIKKLKEELAKKAKNLRLAKKKNTLRQPKATERSS